jgi:hypothetical protein
MAYTITVDKQAYIKKNAERIVSLNFLADLDEGELLVDPVTTVIENDDGNLNILSAAVNTYSYTEDGTGTFVDVGQAVQMVVSLIDPTVAGSCIQYDISVIVVSNSVPSQTREETFRVNFTE